jgi:hypothetical protein
MIKEKEVSLKHPWLANLYIENILNYILLKIVEYMKGE